MSAKHRCPCSSNSARPAAWAAALGAALTLNATPLVWAAEIVVDNSSAYVSATGAWKSQGGRDVYGADARNTSVAGATFVFNVPVPVSGPYEVYLWWPTNRKSSATVPIRVEHAGGIYQTTVDQRSGGSWQRLGVWDFSQTGRITIASPGNGVAIADAVRLVPLLEPLPPPPQPVLGSATLTWQAPTTNSDGSPLTDLAGYVVYASTQSGSYTMNDIVARVPTLSPTGGTTETYQITNLAAGTYHLVVTAYNNAGVESIWSVEVSKTIGVN